MTINTTSGRQLVYIVDNADNNGGKDVVPTEFAGDGTDTQHLATAGDDDGTNDAAHTQHTLSHHQVVVVIAVK